MGKSRALKMRHLAAIFAIALAGTAAAQPYPARVITIVVPLPPGGATDTLARTLADHMRMALRQPIIIENVPGAGGTLGIARVVRAAPDGYTLGVGNWAAYVAASTTYPVRYDVLGDREFTAAGACRHHQANRGHVERALVCRTRRADRAGERHAWSCPFALARHVGAQEHAQ
jgi:hypothetical protein